MDMIPAFPLSIVAFPGEKIKLHIFESRYKQMISEIAERGGTFAIVPYFENKKSNHATEMELVQILNTYEDGKMDIEVKAICPLDLHELHSRYPNRLYPGAEVSRLPWSDEMKELADPALMSALDQLYKVMSIDNVTVHDPAKFRTYQLAHKVGFSIDQEIEFMAIATESERQAYMLHHIEKLLPLAEQVEEMRRRAALNGHIKHLRAGF